MIPVVTELTLNYEHWLVGKRCLECDAMLYAGDSVTLVTSGVTEDSGFVVLHSSCDGPRGDDAAG